jgi:hypothetical protein
MENVPLAAALSVLAFVMVPPARASAMPLEYLISQAAMIRP